MLPDDVLRRLRLQLACSGKTPVRGMLDIWPALPLQVVITSEYYDTLDNIIAARERSDRVCQIDVWGPGFPLKEVLAAMQEPFPELRLLNASFG